MKKFIAVLMVVLLMLSVFAACSKPASETTPEPPAVAAGDSSESTKPETPPQGSGIGDELKINGPIEVKHVGISFETLATDFATAMRDAVIASCEERGWTYEVNEANNDPSRQVAQCEDMLAKGVDILVIKPLDESSFAPISAACAEAGIPLFVTSTFLNSPYTACALADQYQVGVTTAELFMEHNPGTLHKVLHLRGPLAMESFNLRCQGQTDTLEAAGYEIVYETSTQNKQDEGITAGENFISTGQEFDGILCGADGQAIGAAIAAEEAGLADSVYVFGNGGQLEAAENILKGGQLDGTIYLPPSVYINTLFSVIDNVIAAKPYEQKNYVELKYMDANNVKDFYPDL